jgi:sterol 24-C-methyltransferase
MRPCMRLFRVYRTGFRLKMNELPLPFSDGFFDAIYHVQVFSLCKDLNRMCQELFRLLKPGGKFGCLDWILLPDYDPNNPKHRQLMNEVKPLVGAIGSPREIDYIRALQDAGFIVTISKNLSIDGLQAPLIEKADVHFNKVAKAVRYLTRCKMLPSHFKVLLDRLTQGGKAFVSVATRYHKLLHSGSKTIVKSDCFFIEYTKSSNFVCPSFARFL